MDHSRPDGSAAADRGQLYLDVVVGVGIFLLAVSFLIGATTGVFDAVDDGPERPLVADRTVDRLAGPLLGSDAGPSTLDEACTVAFFEQRTADCDFDPTRALTSQVGIGSGYDVNVSLVRPVGEGPTREVLCLDGDAIGRCDSGLPSASVGPPVPDSGASVAVAHRTVFVTGLDATLVVRVW